MLRIPMKQAAGDPADAVLSEMCWHLLRNVGAKQKIRRDNLPGQKENTTPGFLNLRKQ